MGTEGDTSTSIDNEGSPATESTAVPSAGLDFDAKHPLQNSWVMWYDSPRKKTSQESWADNINKLYTFCFVEDFWCLWNNIVPPSQLPMGSNYHLFKDGVAPMWEDPVNVNGGKWIVTVPKSKKSSLDTMWMNVVLGMIGENFEHSDDICGCVISIRKAQDKLTIWTKSAEDVKMQKSIGMKVKNLCLQESGTIGYQVHADALKKNCSFNNQNRYEV